METLTLVRRAACLLDGISWLKSADVDKAFPSVFHMCSATEEEWLAIPGIGSILAKNAVKQLEGK